MGFRESISRPCNNNILSQDGYYIWGGSVIRDKIGLYHMFVSRWAKDKYFSAWLTDSHIVRAVSTEPDGPFEVVEKIESLHSQTWCSKMVHNPTVKRYGDKYYLFYVGTTYENEVTYKPKFDPEHPARYNQQIGVAVADSPGGPWKPSSMNPILSPRDGQWDSTFVTNPSVYEVDGEIRIIYKAKLPKEKTLILGMAAAKDPEGPYERKGPSPLFPYDVEDPCIWKEGSSYRMLVKAMSDELVPAGSGILFESHNGENFEVAADKLAYERVISWQQRDEETVTRLERPQVLLENGKPVCLYNAVGDGDTYAYNMARAIVDTDERNRADD